MSKFKDLIYESYLEYVDCSVLFPVILENFIEKEYKDIGINVKEIKRLFLNIINTCNTEEEILDQLNSWKEGFVFIKDNKITSSSLDSNDFIHGRTVTKDGTYPKGTLLLYLNERILKNMLDTSQDTENRIFGYKKIFELIAHEIIHDQQIEKAAIDLSKITKNRLNELQKYPAGPIRAAIYKEYFANKNEIDAYAKQCCEELINNGIKIDTAINLLKYSTAYNEIKDNSIVFGNYYTLYFNNNAEDMKVFKDFISSLMWFLEKRKEGTNGIA